MKSACTCDSSSSVAATFQCGIVSPLGPHDLFSFTLENVDLNSSLVIRMLQSGSLVPSCASGLTRALRNRSNSS